MRAWVLTRHMYRHGAYTATLYTLSTDTLYLLRLASVSDCVATLRTVDSSLSG